MKFSDSNDETLTWKDWQKQIEQSGNLNLDIPSTEALQEPQLQEIIKKTLPAFTRLETTVSKLCESVGFSEEKFQKITQEIVSGKVGR